MKLVASRTARKDRTRPTPIAPLVIRFGRIGDMVMHAPFLECLHLRFGQPCTLVSTGDAASVLFEGDPTVGEVRTIRGRHTPFLLSPDRWRLIGALKRHEGPVYVSEDIPAQAERIRRLLTHARIPPSHCVFLIDDPPPQAHVVDRLLAFAERTPAAWSSADYPPPSPAVRSAPMLHASRDDRDDAHAWLRQRGWTGGPVVLIQPAGKHVVKWGRQRDHAKAWPLERWGELIRLISHRAQHATFVLCGSANEQRPLRAIRDACGVDAAAVIVGAADLPLRRLMSLMRVAHSLVSVDTGPAHIAAALACPVVVIYGEESPRAWQRRGLAPDTVVELGGGARADAISATAAFEAWLELAHRR